MKVYATSNEYKLSRAAILENKSKCQAPRISIVGTLQAPTEVHVDFELASFMPSTVSRAIDIALKASFLFQFEYPEPCQMVWQFIDCQFYGLQKVTTPAIRELQHSLATIKFDPDPDATQKDENSNNAELIADCC